MSSPIRFEFDELARLVEHHLSPWSEATNRDCLECIKKLIAIAVRQQQRIEAQARDIKELQHLVGRLVSGEDVDLSEVARFIIAEAANNYE